MVNRMIYVTFQKKGLHRFSDAASRKDLLDVSYLANYHRHLFHFKVSISVEHNDREIEFHQFLNWLESLYDNGVMELNNRSCEMIADELYTAINEKYSKRRVVIDVSEDGECGAIVEYTKNWE